MLIVDNNVYNFLHGALLSEFYKTLPPAELIMIFNSLSVDVLEKTLKNIHPDNLREILVVKLAQTKVEQILNRLPEYTVREILDRINPP